MMVHIRPGSRRTGDFGRMTLTAGTEEERSWLTALDSIFRRGGKLEITPVLGERVAVEFDEERKP
jgi:hypothetical protein